MRIFPTLVLLLALVVAGAAAADSFSFSKSRSTTSYRFGDLAVLEQYDGRGTNPLWWVEMKHFRRVLGSFEGASFEEIYADPEHGYFVGVSNTGIPGTSVIVFDAQGEQIIHWGHSGWAGYCRESVTIERVWLAERADAVFEYETSPEGDVQLRDISLMRCDGQRFSLDEAGGGDFAKALAQYRATPAAIDHAKARRISRVAACAAKDDCALLPASFTVPGQRGEAAR